MLKEKVARAIRQLKKGKTEYFDEIYDLTRASVYYVIRGVLKDNYLVEDAMQETYVAFLNSVAKIDDEQNPLSYLLQIAKNKALDEARRMTRAAGANIDDVEIAEFCDDLVEKKKDLQECIDDINNPDGDDSYGEILSDLLEIVKEELFEQED